MSIDKSLKVLRGVNLTRNVLKRAERMLVLQDEGRWEAEKGAYNLPKTKYRVLKPGQSGPKRPGASD